MAISRGRILPNPQMEMIKYLGGQVNSAVSALQNQQRIRQNQEMLDEEKRKSRANDFFKIMQRNANAHAFKWAGYMNEEEGQDALQYYLTDLLEVNPAVAKRTLQSIPDWGEMDGEVFMKGVHATQMQKGTGALETQLATDPGYFVVPTEEARRKQIEKAVGDVVEGTISTTTPEKVETKVIPNEVREVTRTIAPEGEGSVITLYEKGKEDQEPLGIVPRGNQVIDPTTNEVIGTYDSEEKRFIPKGMEERVAPQQSVVPAEEGATPAPERPQARFPAAQALVDTGAGIERERQAVVEGLTRREEVDATTAAAPALTQGEPVQRKRIVTETTGGQTYDIAEIKDNKIVINEPNLRASGATFTDIADRYLRVQGDRNPSNEAKAEWMRGVWKMNAPQGTDFDTFASTLYDWDELEIPLGGLGTAEYKAQTTDSKAVNRAVHQDMTKVKEEVTMLSGLGPEETDERMKHLEKMNKPLQRVNKIRSRLKIMGEPGDMLAIMQRIAGGTTPQEIEANFRTMMAPNQALINQKVADAQYMQAQASLMTAEWRTKHQGMTPEEFYKAQTAMVNLDIAKFNARMMWHDPSKNWILGGAYRDFKIANDYFEEMGWMTPKKRLEMWRKGKMPKYIEAAWVNYAQTMAATYPNKYDLGSIGPKEALTIFGLQFGGSKNPLPMPVLGPAQGAQVQEEEEVDQSAVDNIADRYGF